jgi:polysaccharide chain length determinant protein (PEP-CTERM system associated)
MPTGRENPTVSQNSTLDLVLEVWHRRKWLAILTFTAIFLSVLTIARALPDIYRATATLLVVRPPAAEAFGKSVVTGDDIESMRQTITQQMLSRARLGELIRRLKLYPEGGPALEAVIEGMRNNIQIEVKAEAKAVDQPWLPATTIAYAVSYRGRDPETVARVANALASFNVEESAKMHEQRATGASEYAGLLQAQLADAVKRLDRQEERIREFKRRYGSELVEQLPVNLTRLERLNTELRLNGEARNRAREQRAELAKELAGKQFAKPGVIETPAARLAKLRQELRELSTRYTDKYPDVARVKREIAELEMLLGDDGPGANEADRADPLLTGARDALREVDAKLEALRADEERLRDQIAVYQSRVDRVPQREQELQEISRNYTATKELYSSLLKRSEEAELTGTLEHRKGEQVRLLDPATTPTQAAAPNRIRLVMFGALLALATAAVITTVAERIQTVFHTTDELRGFTRVPVLASIPLIVTRADLVRRCLRSSLLTASALLGLALVIVASHHFATDNEFLVWMLMRGSKS